MTGDSASKYEHNYGMKCKILRNCVACALRVQKKGVCHVSLLTICDFFIYSINLKQNQVVFRVLFDGSVTASKF